MATRTSVVQSEHDAVVSASAKTYGEMERQGYEVSINLGGEKNQSVGPASNPRYPDVVVWMPDYPGSTKGKPAVIEEIETADSVTDSEAEQWKDYGSLGITFRLIVPKGYCTETSPLITKYKASISELWYYYYEYGNIKFEKYR